MNKYLRKTLIYLFSFIVIVIIWAVACEIVGNDYVLPSPWETFAKLGDVIGQKNFRTAYGNTMLRSLISFAISLVAALFVATLSKLSRILREMIVPVLAVMRSLPTMAVILMLLVWLNPGTAPIAVTIMVILPMLYTSALAAFDQVDIELISMCRVYKVPVLKRILHVYLPISGAYLVSESGAALAFSVKLMVSAEVLSNTYKSLGGMISQSKVYMDMPEMLALTMFAVATGVAIELLFGLIQRLLFRWRDYD